MILVTISSGDDFSLVELPTISTRKRWPLCGHTRIGKNPIDIRRDQGPLRPGAGPNAQAKVPEGSCAEGGRRGDSVEQGNRRWPAARGVIRAVGGSHIRPLVQ